MALKAGYKGLKNEDILKIEAAVKTTDEIKCTEDTAGTYVLQATVDDEGEVTYSWESTT